MPRSKRHPAVTRTDKLLDRLRRGDDPTLVSYARKRSLLVWLMPDRVIRIPEAQEFWGIASIAQANRILNELYAEGFLNRKSVSGTGRTPHYEYSITEHGRDSVTSGGSS